MRRLWITSVFLLIATVFIPAAPQAQWRTKWSYSGADGPARWAQLDPEYSACNGKQQSPIDIRRTQKANLPALQFEFKNGPLRIVNNGYTAVRVDYARGNGNFLIVGSTRYELTQFHFHHPSEERIDGRAHDMVIHFMYRSGDGKVAGVAVLVDAGNPKVPDPADQRVIRQLWRYMPKAQGKPHEIPGVQINPAGLLPQNTAYYTYMGSLTAPPCTEGIKWFVLKAPVEIPAAQINAFAALYWHDVRPVQPLNGRVVQESP